MKGFKRVLWGDWLNSAAAAFGTSATEAGIIMSLVFIIVLVLISVAATRGRRPEITITVPALLGVILFTFIGWFPVWTASVLALIVVAFLAKTVSGGLG